MGGKGWRVSWIRRRYAASMLRVGLSALAFSLVCALAAHASTGAEGAAAPVSHPTIENYNEGQSAEREAGQADGSSTDPAVAERLPHSDLGRDDALRLLSQTFGAELQKSAGPFAGLEAERFLSKYVAVIPAGPGQPHAILLDSSLPLVAPNSSGDLEAVDLSLEHADGELQPANPLAEIGISEELGDGIELSAARVQVDLAGAPKERAPSILEDGVGAAYPNVAEDTDFAATPTPTGVETYMQIRSPEAPPSQTLELTMPPGADLLRSEEGGAAVVSDGQTLVTIAPATAIDATGAPVDVSLAVADNRLTYTVEAEPKTAYPILVDPLIQEYVWGSGTYTNIGDWKAEQSPTPFVLATSAACGTWCQGYLAPGSPGLWIAAWDTSYDAPGYQGGFSYYVPRWSSDWATYGESPHSYISHANYFAVSWQHRSDSNLSPYLVTGLWSPELAQFQSSEWFDGKVNLTLGGSVIGLNGKNTSKEAIFTVVSSDYHVLSARRDAWLGWATLELADENHPKGNEPGITAKWVNNAPTSPIPFEFTDVGLGVYSVTVSDNAGHSWKTLEGCVGVASNPCPRKWGSAFSGQPALNYDPSVLPTGIDLVELVAADPIGHTNVAPAPENPKVEAQPAQIKVDHLQPTVSLSGPMTEQASLGYGLPAYTVKINTTDGVAGQPQSGVTKVLVKADGAVQKEWLQACAQSCGMTKEWSLESSKFSNGQHTVEVLAEDGVGLITAAKQMVDIDHDVSPPSVTLSGTMTEQATLGTTLPRYSVNAAATDAAGEGLVSFSAAFGSSGSGNGQFNHPADVAIDPEGHLWVPDRSNNRLQEFSATGEFMNSLGSSGSGNGQFSAPKSIAFAPDGSFWVADSGNNRLQKFNSKGEFVKAVGSAGSGNGQFSGPEGIAIDAEGNLWVSDTYNYRIQKLSSAGEFIKVVNPGGMGSIEPTGIDVAKGNVWVTDWAGNRVVELTEAGALVRSFGTAGTGNEQFNRPDAVTVAAGTVWIGDQNNSRIQGFSESGEYVRKFGTAGSGAGQFSFSYPFGMAADGKGNLWIADANNNRVQKWAIAGGSQSGVISTTLKVDGKVVDTYSPGCGGPPPTCTISRQWALTSSNYAPGVHVLEANAKDAAGLTSPTKTVTFNIEPDTMKPAIELSGPLAEAPEGWVEQGPYNLTATASDPGGYGAKQLLLKIDEKLVGETAATSCLDGGCQKIKTWTVNAAQFPGGAHTVEVIGLDNADNSQSTTFTMNVDPKGSIGAGESADTLEAMAETSPVNPVGPSKEEEEYEGTYPDLTLEDGEEGIEAAGTATPVTIGGDGPCAVEMESLASDALTPEQETGAEASPLAGAGQPPTSGSLGDGEEVRLIPEGEPVSVASDAASADPCDAVVMNEAAAVETNTSQSVDTITRPLYDGSMIFQAIRGPEAPEEYSWEFHLREGLELKSIDQQTAGLFWTSNGSLAMAIGATLAHDAAGRQVQTTLGVTEGHVITLTVHYKASNFAYPILAGTAMQVGYEAATVYFPPGTMETEGEEEPAEESIEEEGPLVIAASISPPESKQQLSGAEASELELQPYDPHAKLRKKFKFTVCRPHRGFDSDPGENAGGPGGGSAHMREQAEHLFFDCHNPEHEGLFWAVSVHGRFHMVFHKRVWLLPSEWDCNTIWGDEGELPVLGGCKAFYNETPHQANGFQWVKGPIYVRGRYRFPAFHGHWGVGKPACLTIGGNLFPNPRKAGDAPYEQPLVYHRPEYLDQLGEPCPGL